MYLEPQTHTDLHRGFLLRTPVRSGSLCRESFTGTNWAQCGKHREWLQDCGSGEIRSSELLKFSNTDFLIVNDDEAISPVGWR